MFAKIAATGAAVATLLAAPLALAQDKGQFGEQGDFIFGADRLFSLFAYTSNSYGTTAGTVTSNGTSMSLLWGANGINGGGGGGVPGVLAGNPTFYSAPRVGFDYVLIPHLTLGGEVFAWFTLGGSTSTPVGNGVTQSTSAPSGTEFGIAPRVGYIIGLNDTLSLWLRGGLSYYVANWGNLAPAAGGNCNDSASLDTFGIDLDPQLVISPVNHFAFIAGPALDWGFTGGWSSTACNRNITTSGNYNTLNFSLTGGLIGWL